MQLIISLFKKKNVFKMTFKSIGTKNIIQQTTGGVGVPLQDRRRTQIKKLRAHTKGTRHQSLQMPQERQL